MDNTTAIIVSCASGLFAGTISALFQLYIVSTDRNEKKFNKKKKILNTVNQEIAGVFKPFHPERNDWGDILEHIAISAQSIKTRMYEMSIEYAETLSKDAIAEINTLKRECDLCNAKIVYHEGADEPEITSAASKHAGHIYDCLTRLSDMLDKDLGIEEKPVVQKKNKKPAND